MGLTRVHVAKLKACAPLDDQKLLRLAVVVMPAARNARVRGEIAELAAIGCLEHLYKHTACIAMLGYGVGKFFYW